MDWNMYSHLFTIKEMMDKVEQKRKKTISKILWRASNEYCPENIEIKRQISFNVCVSFRTLSIAHCLLYVLKQPHAFALQEIVLRFCKQTFVYIFLFSFLKMLRRILSILSDVSAYNKHMRQVVTGNKRLEKTIWVALNAWVCN